GGIGWIAEHWFEALQSAGIIAGLILTCIALRQDIKVRRISNLIAVTAEHRDIWSKLYQKPELARVLDAAADPERTPVAQEEELFITMLVLHLYSVFRAVEGGLYLKLEGLEKDVAMFFSLPLVRVVWTKLKPLQDEEFVRFVEACLGGS
ncbi:MAG: hypothetical protein KGS61_14810, partial [Verrucomicrobia bacterium]|nr:hypothetical protein [Verrucomicrobiota bacterium]